MRTDDFDILLKYYIYNGFYRMNFTTSLLVVRNSIDQKVIDVLNRYAHEVINEYLKNIREGIDNARRDSGEI